MKKAAEILSRLLDKGPAGAQPFHSLFGAWRDIAGESLAEHCRAYEVRHRSLLVEADHPGWMQLLLLQKKAILARIRQRFPQLELRDIKVRFSAATGAGGRKPAIAARQPATAARAAGAAKAGAPAKPAEPSAAPAEPASQDKPPADGPAGAPASADVEQALAAVSDLELKRKLRLLLQELERRIDTSDDK
jgi:hypothetical protein